MSKERPIIFNTKMVKALLEGRKTQTRRPMKVQPDETGIYEQAMAPGSGALWNKWAIKIDGKMKPIKSPYGKIGDRLWVRETMVIYLDDAPPCYLAGNDVDDSKYSEEQIKWFAEYGKEPIGKSTITVPSIHMPRWASRITLEITDVRVERVQEIKTIDALEEGINLPIPSGCDSAEFPEDFDKYTKEKQEQWIEGQARGMYFARCADAQNHIDAFQKLWDSIYKAKALGWDENPWVWIYTFKVV